MAFLGLSGLASGVDTGSIVDQLMAIERQSLSRIRLKQSRLQAQDAGLKDIQAKLSALKSASEALRAPGVWANTQTITSGDPARISTERLSDTAPGTYQVSVTQLARGTQRAYDYTSPTGANGSITIAGVVVDVAKGATLDDVVSSINARADVAVYAANVSGKLVLTSRSTGTLSDFAATGGSIVERAAEYVPGQNSKYSVDGGTVLESQTNTVDDALPGTRLTLKALTGATPVAITITPPGIDKEAAKAKIKTFVEAYNAVLTVTHAKTSEKTVPAATTNADALKGQLFGDRSLTQLISGLRTGMSDIVAGNVADFDALSDLGITTGAIGAGMSAISGTLTIDDAKLTKALDTDVLAVRRLLGGEPGVNGLTQRVELLVATQVGSTGAIDARLKSSAAEQTRLTELLRTTDTRLGLREKRLRSQFAAMESALQASQTQQAWLQGQLATLNFS